MKFQKYFLCSYKQIIAYVHSIAKKLICKRIKYFIKLCWVFVCVSHKSLVKAINAVTDNLLMDCWPELKKIQYIQYIHLNKKKITPFPFFKFIFIRLSNINKYIDFTTRKYIDIFLHFYKKVFFFWLLELYTFYFSKFRGFVSPYLIVGL